MNMCDKYKFLTQKKNHEYTLPNKMVPWNGQKKKWCIKHC